MDRLSRLWEGARLRALRDGLGDAASHAPGATRVSGKLPSAGTAAGFCLSPRPEEASRCEALPEIRPLPSRATARATLRAGDVGLGRTFSVVEGEAIGLVLGEAEALWVRACWGVTGGSSRGQ